MLQSMREKTQGLIAGIIVTMIALTFMFWGVQNYYGGGDIRAVAKVNGKKITQRQVRITYEQLKHREMYKGDFFLGQKTQARLRQEALQQLIKEEVISQAINQMGFRIGQEQLWSIVTDLPIFQVNGRFSPEQFQRITERLFYSGQNFLDSMKLAFLQTQLESGIVKSSFVLPNEIEFSKKLLLQRRDFGYFIVPMQRFANVTKVATADIEKYYKQHQSEFVVPEKISIQYLELSAENLRHKVNLAEDKLRQYYQSHIGSFSTPKKWEVLKVSLPLAKQADAKAVANAREKLLQAKDDLVKVAGAQTTKVWLTRSEADPGFAPQLHKLAVGQVSQPFRTQDGYSVGKVLAVQSETAIPYKEVKDKVKKVYEQQQLAQLFAEANDKLINLTYINPDSLEPAARELGLQLNTTGLTTSAGAKSGILANNKVVSIAFSEAVLKHRYNSNPVEISPGKLVVLRIKDHVPETVQPLAQVSKTIKGKLAMRIMRHKASALSQELVAKLRKQSAVELARQYNFTWKTMTNVEYEQQAKDSALVKAAFALDKPIAGKVAATVVDLVDGYAVLQLLKVYDAKTHATTAKEEQFLKALPVRLGRVAYQLLLDGLMNKAEVKIND